MAWKDLRIATKLYAGFGLVITLAVAVALFNVKSNTITGQAAVDCTEITYPRVDLANHMIIATVQVQQYCQDISATRGWDGLDDGLAKADQAAQQFRTHLAELSKLDTQHQQSLSDIGRSFEEYYAAGVSMARVYIADGPAAGNKKMPEFDATSIDIQNRLQAYLGESESEFLSSLQAVKADTDRATNVGIILSAIALLVSLVLAVTISRGVARPISGLANLADQIAIGDLSHDITVSQKDEVGTLAASFRSIVSYLRDLSVAAERIAANDLTTRIEPKSEKDVLGQAFRTMIFNLSGMVRQLSDNARELVSAATEISTSAEQISKGANLQAEQVGMVGTAVEEMTATIFESSRNAGDASGAARGAAETALNGGQIVNDTIRGMQEIATVVRESANSITRLAQSTDQIGEIISVIDDIADQTNLLALNAAIEAARAGEQGRGFAVVADEVRKLAERTGKATGEITEMIKGVQAGTGEAVQSMRTGLDQVERGRELADRAGNSLNEIVSMAQHVTDMVAQIATAAEQQSAAAEDISRNIEHINSVTRETATGAGQSAAAAEQLNRQAESLQQMVAKFKVRT